MSETEENMVVPRDWNLVDEISDPYLCCSSDPVEDAEGIIKHSDEPYVGKKKCFMYRDDELFERCEYRVNSAVCYHKLSDKKLRSVKVDFVIKMALYCQLDDKGEDVDYLLLVGQDEICFYRLQNPSFETIKIPFDIENVFATKYGILIARQLSKSEEESEEVGANICHLFSLSHPYSEVLPVLFKHKKAASARYAFTGEEITVLKATNDLFLAHDSLKNNHIVCELRKCSMAEKKEASRDANNTTVGLDSTMFSWRHTPLQVPNMTSTPKVFTPHTPDQITPLRRSIRNRARQAANVNSTSLFQHDCQSVSGMTPLRMKNTPAASSMKSSMISYRSKFSGINFPNNFENLEIDQIDAELILDHIYTDVHTKVVSSSMIEPMDVEPGSVLDSKAEEIESESEEEDTTSDEPAEKKSKDDWPLNFKGFPKVKKHRLFKAVDEIIKNESQSLAAMIESEIKVPKRRASITSVEQAEVQRNIAIQRADILRKKLESGDEKARKLQALKLYKKELLNIWRVHKMTNFKRFPNKRCGSNLFVTVDDSGAEFIVIAFDDNTIKFVSWNKQRIGHSVDIEGSDAIQIIATKMIAVLSADKQVVRLYTGPKEISKLVINPPLNLLEHDILKLVEGPEMTVLVKFQDRKHFKISTVLFDVSNAAPEYILPEPVIDLIAFKKNVDDMKLMAFPSESEMKKWSSTRWPNDIRLENVSQMLDSSKMPLIPHRNQLDWEDEKVMLDYYDTFLVDTYPKTVAKAFGRAILNFCTQKASKVSLEAIPKIEINGKVAPLQLHPFPAHENVPSRGEWAEFYTGAAHVLSLTDFEGDKVSFAWLRQWQEETTNSLSVTSGCIYGFGLTGQFKSVNLYDIHSMIISSKRSMDSISILLGCAIAFRGTSHLQCYRTVVTHLPSFIEPTLVELKFEPIVQVASILSLGFLFQDTMNASITNKLINEMAKETFFENDPGHERYNYVFCAGVAVGLINLGRGVEIRNAEIPIRGGNNEVEDRLYCLLNGESRVLCTDFGRRNKNLCKNQRIGVAALNSVGTSCNNLCTGVDYAVIHGIGLTGDTAALNLPFNEVSKTTANSATGILFKESSLTKELPFVNIHLTSPAACIALALMYLKTGDSYVINMLKTPETLPLIEKIRPDVLMMRTLCALMVDFDNIVPTADKLLVLIPNVIKRYIQLIMSEHGERHWFDDDVDLTSVVEAYFYIRAGITLALGIRYSSTNNLQVYRVMQDLHRDLDGDTRKGSGLMAFVKDSVIQYCEAISGLSMALVYAGSGQIDVLRILRKIKNFRSGVPLVEGDQTVYSVHTIIDMAIGILFMGHGRFGFGRSKEAIAMLLLSVFPIFPHHVGDNRCYFQPMRLLWSLAAEYRHLVAIDDDTHTPIRLRVKVEFKGNLGTAVMFTPHTFPPLEEINFLTMDGPNGTEIKFDMRLQEDRETFKKIMADNHGRFPIERQKKKYERVFSLNFAATGAKNTPADNSIYQKFPKELLRALL